LIEVIDTVGTAVPAVPRMHDARPVLALL